MCWGHFKKRFCEDVFCARLRLYALAILVVFLAGCSHRVLTFFFTGVPDPNSTAVMETNASDEEAITQATEADVNIIERIAIPEQTDFTHGPWANRRCDYCHQAGSGRSFNALQATATNISRLAYPIEELCIGCHSEAQFTGAGGESWLHAPVATRQCTVCHSPHNAKRQFLLLSSNNIETCTACHSGGAGQGSSTHIQDRTDDCVECHNPHAGSSPMLLRKGVTT